MLAVVAMVLATTLGAQVSIPLGVVPGTMQTLALLTGAGLLGARRAAAAMVVYVALGLCGVPVFQGWRSLAPSDFVQSTSAGYLLGFIVAAAWVGSRASQPRALLTWLGIMLLGHFIILAFGLPVLVALTDWDTGLHSGFLALLPGMAAKSLLAAGAVYLLRRRLARNASSMHA